MSLLDIPFLNNYKTAIAGWGIFLIGLANLGLALGHCFQGDVSVAMCVSTAQASFPPLLTSFGGLGILGLGHKLEKLKSAM